MDNRKNDIYYVEKIRTDLEFIVTHMENVNMEDLEKHEILLDSMLFRLIQISENAKRLSYEYIMENDDIPWNKIYGLRNRIVHDYGNVKFKVIYGTLKNDVPEMLKQINNIF